MSPLAILEKVVGKAGWSVSDIKLIPLPGDARIAKRAREGVRHTSMQLYILTIRIHHNRAAALEM